MNPPSDVELIAEFTLHLHVERNLSAHTVAAYATDLLQFSEFVSKKHVLLFTADKQHTAGLLQHLAQHDMQPRSRSRKISALKSFYGWLIRNERLDKDPMRLISAPKLPRLLPHPVDSEHMATMLETSARSAAVDGAGELALRDHAIVEVMYGAGLRVSELCNLKETDVTLNTGVARVLGKGSKERIVPLGDGAVHALENYQKFARPLFLKNKKKGCRALFLSSVGRQISTRQVCRIITRLGGDQHVHPHRLRHSCATDMLTGGADLRAVQEQLGHGSIATTQIYTKVSPAHLQDAHSKFHPRGAARKVRS